MLISTANLWKSGQSLLYHVKEGQNLFGLGDEVRSEPIAKSAAYSDTEVSDRKHYGECWLDVIGQLAREQEIAIANGKLHRTKFLLKWDHIDYSWAIAQQFFDDAKAYIREVCRGWVQICEKLFTHFGTPPEWKPYGAKMEPA